MYYVSCDRIYDHMIVLQSSMSVIRANTIVCLADLMVRFPNLVEPWTAHLYNRCVMMTHGLDDITCNTTGYEMNQRWCARTL